MMSLFFLFGEKKPLEPSFLAKKNSRNAGSAPAKLPVLLGKVQPQHSSSSSSSRPQVDIPVQRKCVESAKRCVPQPALSLRPMAQSESQDDPPQIKRKSSSAARPPAKRHRIRIDPNAVKNLDGDEDWSSFVGSVFESNADHIARHRGTPHHEKICLRCHYIRNKTDIQRWAPWAAPRPRHMGGAWRLGCDVCTWALGNRTAREKHASRRGNDIRASTFARQNFTCNKRYCDFELKLRAHAQCQYHRVASSAANRLAGQFPRRMLRETEPHVAPGGKEASVRPMAQETAEGNDEEMNRSPRLSTMILSAGVTGPPTDQAMALCIFKTQP